MAIKKEKQNRDGAVLRQLKVIVDDCRVKPGKRVQLADFDPAWAGNKKVPKDERKELAGKLLSEDVSDLANAQELLYASDTWAVLVVLQAIDAAGKDGTIRHVMSGVNPQGCVVTPFKQPSSEELDHDFMWRCVKALPERGKIGIFNRSYYEEVLVVRVHPQYLEAERLPGASPNKDFWKARYEDINNFERYLSRNGTRIIKFFLHVSKEEQRARFLDRINDPEKHWKFSATDVKEREHWDAYMQAYEEMLSATSSEWAPWYVIPADHKWVSRALVANILANSIRKLDLSYPPTTPEKLKQIKVAKRILMSEK